MDWWFESIITHNGSPRWFETLKQEKYNLVSGQQHCFFKSFLVLKVLCRSLWESSILSAPTSLHFCFLLTFFGYCHAVKHYPTVKI